MSSIALRRPRPAPRRASARHESVSPSTVTPLRTFAVHRTHATADFTEADEDEDEDEEHRFENNGNNNSNSDNNNRTSTGLFDNNNDSNIRRRHGQGYGNDDAAGRDQGGQGDDGEEDRPPRRRNILPVLPLFSSTHLDTLPVYSLTHAIRIIVSARTETTLTWDQLRSPQVSQFLIKPMQQQIRNQHFSRATLYALMANCLQFTKEGQLYAANAGTSNTRAKVCELLALKLLKEYSTRELIDALAYDFYPLQGLPGSQPPPMTAGSSSSKTKNTPLVASRTSTLEVAIRASAKHFLAHPVVVQQLEAIWNGAISFYSSADSLHRESPSSPFSRSNSQPKVDDRTPLLGSLNPKQGHFAVPPGRRTVMLYDPRQASLLKLSRLRVPRYRSFLSTLSLAVLIGLFLAVLARRSTQITGLELVFWFWSAGFMLDELVGFNEQGFALYIMSFWNIFDLGILVLLIGYYCMRVYGVFLADPHHWNAMAYDVLAANAILLLPRIFSILDHYQYFSQLLIAFRLMAADLAAVCVLILIVCSGFYVFFTSSTASSDGGEVAFKIFQILMGFTPAAWDVWPSYNWLARALLCLFLIICHFLIVTILITVLTNSFMAIASNATEEHQFLFAINTISMVKNDALFSYIAPTNIFAWLLMPLRYCMPLRHFVLLNRVIIKATHCPILFCIYLYERFWLAPSMFEPTDLVENPGRGRNRAISFGDMANRTNIFSPSTRVREESVAGYQKDRALDELFMRMPDATRTQRRHERRKTQTAIRNWMDRNDQDGVGSNWPPLDSRAVPDWQRRMSMGWDLRSNSRQMSDLRSIVSDPADLASNVGGTSHRAFPMVDPRFMDPRFAHLMPEYKDHTDADGDDELVTNDEDEDDLGTSAGPHGPTGGNAAPSETDDYFTTTPTGARSAVIASSHSSSDKGNASGKLTRRELHSRTLSTNTILYNPGETGAPTEGSPSASPPKAPVPAGRSGHAADMAASESLTPTGMRSPPRRSHFSPPGLNTRSTMPAHGLAGMSNLNISTMLGHDSRNRDRASRRLSSVDLSILSDNTNLPFVADVSAGLPGSFQTQMAMAMMKDSRLRSSGGSDTADRDRMGRLVLARMKTLEESFADVIKEMRDLKSSSTAPTTRRNSSGEDLRMASPPDTGRSDRPKSRKGTATPKKATSRRPASGRSMKESKLGLTMMGDVKGKGKYIASSTEEEGEGAGDSLLKKTSSL
ncbi:hypothetical protein J3F83DRAFT_23122 [Trichoderma novae-zelandiae]